MEKKGSLEGKLKPLILTPHISREAIRTGSHPPLIPRGGAGYYPHLISRRQDGIEIEGDYETLNLVSASIRGTLYAREGAKAGSIILTDATVRGGIDLSSMRIGRFNGQGLIAPFILFGYTGIYVDLSKSRIDSVVSFHPYPTRPRGLSYDMRELKLFLKDAYIHHLDLSDIDCDQKIKLDLRGAKIEEISYVLISDIFPNINILGAQLPENFKEDIEKHQQENKPPSN